MSQEKTHRSLTFALYLNAAVLTGILIVMLGKHDFPQILPGAYAQNQPPIGGGAGVFIVPAQFSPNLFGVYLMDIDAQTIMAYRYLGDTNQLKLVAARNFRYDRKLGNYNTLPPPMEIQGYVENEAQTRDRVMQRPNDRPAVEPPQKQE